jgi:4-hydroxybenzoate polyprenyltransferase
MRRFLKAYRWWDVKIPPLLALAYFLLLQASPPVPLVTILVSLALFIVASIGIAGFAHLLNDLFDVQVDKVSAAENMARGKRSRHLRLLSALIVVALVPWLFLPLGLAGWMLLTAEFALFAAYSIPPIRLKARGVWGALADALYAHTIPILVMWVMFAALCGLAMPLWFGAVLAVWAFTFGLRQILQHQLNDRLSDQQEHIQTFAVQYGHDTTLAVMRNVLFPIECLAFLALLVVYSMVAPWVAVGFILYFPSELVKMHSLWLQPIPNPLRPVPGAVVNVWGLLFLNGFYERWLPLLLLLGLVLVSPTYLVLAGLHLVLFKNGIVDLVRTLQMLRARQAKALSIQI